MAWAQNPGDEWLQKFAAYTCPAKGEDAAPVADNADQPLITCDDEGQKFLLSKAVIEGTQLKSASYGIPQNGTTYAVNLGFKGSARDVFGKTTTALNQNGGTFAIVLDGQVISYAGVNEPILDGNAQITGDFNGVRGPLARQLPEVRRPAAEVHRPASRRSGPRWPATSSPRASTPASSAC